MESGSILADPTKERNQPSVALGTSLLEEGTVACTLEALSRTEVADNSGADIGTTFKDSTTK